MSSSKVRHCVFCGLEIAPGERACEHVIPQGLLDHLQIRQAAIAPAHTKPNGTPVYGYDAVALDVDGKPRRLDSERKQFPEILKWNAIPSSRSLAVVRLHNLRFKLASRLA